MQNRKTFIKQSALFGSIVLLQPFELFKKSGENVGLQLYTLRDLMPKDPKGTLEKVAALGYKEVETFGYNGKFFGMTAGDFAALLKTLGLKSPSGHYYPVGFFYGKDWEDKWRAACEDGKKIGQEYIVIPWMEPNYRKPETYQFLLETMNKAGEITKSFDLQLGYHNHNFEFEKIGDKTGYEKLLEGTDPKLVKFEMDLYWVKKAGHDPIELFKKYPGRFPLWHVKDMDNTDKQFFTEVGNGIIDFKAIFAHAKESGMKHFFVEQDQCPGSPLDSIAKSINYLEKNILKS